MSENDEDPALPQQDPNAPANPIAGVLPMVGAMLRGITGNDPSGPLAQVPDTLQQLASTYGTGAAEPPPVAQTPPAPDIRVVSTDAAAGTTPDSVAAAQAGHSDTAGSFGAIDDRLSNQLDGLADHSNTGKTAMDDLVRNLTDQLTRLGVTADTPAGRQQMQDVLGTALQNAQNLVSGSSDAMAQAAAAIDKLADEFLHGHGDHDNAPAPDPATTAPPPDSAPSPQDTPAGKAVQAALTEVGKPYVYGATGPNSFDCSGLTHYAADAAGIDIPRTAADQYQQLDKIATDSIRPGDLIFPAAEFNGGYPTHVMLYIGDDQCVEAPTAGQSVHVVGLPANFHASRWAT
ncbi:NlpC/P60 family protein [Nocardia sp. alder85J]|uniref:NlpC/P60 family protein n=1 Tax=Nocardia sp. alder85J TaxID=2862949 RepID=UPI001CD4CC80|nr:NlpC/P60 family protein [Nocardia sp. alder85J]MCX4095503.1 NlpC/P60 family protein [Nocardia sp. alder85J]